MEKLDLEILTKIGKFTKTIREQVTKIPKEGTKLSEIVEFIEKEIFNAGYMPAFPATVCINEIAAHYTFFEEDRILQKGDLVKIDFGIYHKGYISDNAFTLEISTEQYKTLMQKNIEALNKVLNEIQVGTTLNEIGKMVNDIAKANGYNTIHNLCGHEIGKDDLHYGLHIPNYANGSQQQIKENMEIAIEPFFTTGQPLIKNGKPSHILHLKNDIPIRDIIAKKVLTHIKKNYPKLPFSKRWLLKEFDKKQIIYALNLLKKHGIIYEYEILESISGDYISQFEETIYFDGRKKIIITRL